ncbi:uncharacterized protein KGF55_002423 [Candida pseudojiufengensis]|uniref:uncharacterized protein n=1 Tax=Candida pseudojiufengensis TaxID=497109 RepID=UPI0022255831|nr:uncharacterized protein KGF55_002423 [Candida pseudojiufengensis]KAI5963543.1 hypothetical protein KGF55_002423 [Candida pseudojiufengensis]
MTEMINTNDYLNKSLLTPKITTTSPSLNSFSLATPTSNFKNKPRPMSLYTTPPLDFNSSDNDEIDYEEEDELKAKNYTIDDHKSIQISNISFTPPSSINSIKDDQLQEIKQNTNKGSIFFTPEKSNKNKSSSNKNYLQPPPKIESLSSSSTPIASKGSFSPSKLFKKFSLKLKNYSNNNINSESKSNTPISSPNLKSKSKNSSPFITQEPKNSKSANTQTQTSSKQNSSSTIFSTPKLSSPSLRYSKSLKRFSRHEGKEEKDKSEDKSQVKKNENLRHSSYFPNDKELLKTPTKSNQPNFSSSPAKASKLNLDLEQPKIQTNINSNSYINSLGRSSSISSTPRTPNTSKSTHTFEKFSNSSNSSPKFSKNNSKFPSHSEFYNTSTKDEKFNNTVISFSGYSIKDSETNNNNNNNKSNASESPTSMSYDDTTLNSFESYLPNQISRNKSQHKHHHQVQEPQHQHHHQQQNYKPESRRSSIHKSKRNSYIENNKNNSILKLKILLDDQSIQSDQKQQQINQLNYISIKLNKNKLKNINELINIIIFKIMNFNKILNLNNLKLSIVFMNKDDNKKLNPIILKNSVVDYQQQQNNKSSEIFFNNDDLLLDYVLLKSKLYIRAQF